MIHLLSAPFRTPIDEGSIGSYWLIVQEETGKLSGSRGDLKIG
jgi:hypothetical protein